MPKRLTPKSDLNNLKTEAKRRLKAMRASDPAATLRAAQHTVALDYGFTGWPALKEALAALALSRLTEAERIDIVLRQSWEGDPIAALRIAERHPEIAHASLATAVVFGDLAEVERRLADDPSSATRKAGSRDWEPLLYLAYSRLPIPAASDNAMAIALALLDAGADPNAGFDDGWGSPFKVLTGLIGHGEQGRAPHPRAGELVDLLIARGADPFDTQALYDTSLGEDDVTWLEILYGACQARGDEGRWKAVAPGLKGRLGVTAIDYLLGNAVTHNHAKRAEWLLDHGADPSGPNSYSGQPHRVQAALNGFADMAALLARRGAAAVTLAPEQAFWAAAMRLDADAAREVAQAHPEALENPSPLIVAAGAGRADVVKLLLELGMPADLRQHDDRRALHSAASSGSIPTARLLIEAGADIDARGTQYDATPIGFAYHFGQREMTAYLASLSRDVFTLAHAGLADRLAAVIDADPALANARRPDGRTPLFHLPDHEEAAAAVARLLLDRGADRMAAQNDGLTAAKLARRRGLDEAADLIDGL